MYWHIRVHYEGGRYTWDRRAGMGRVDVTQYLLPSTCLGAPDESLVRNRPSLTRPSFMRSPQKSLAENSKVLAFGSSLVSTPPEWRNWHTQQTQNLPGFTPRGGSSPFSGISTTTSLSGHRAAVTEKKKHVVETDVATTCALKR